MEKYLLGCDWGTTSFRLGLFDVANKRLLGEIRTGDGIASTHSSWKSLTEAKNGITKHDLFRRELAKHIKILSEKLSVNLEHVLILISGMASSSIGMEDLPYAGLPFALDGSQAVIRRLDAQSNFPHEIVMISGIRSERDVMRGEETQLIGLLSLLKSSDIQMPANAILIFPGTHSKHIYIQNDQLIDFRTFMTGEIFHMLATHSILKDSVDLNNMNDFSEADSDAFRRGVKESHFSMILNALFMVRTNQLFNTLDKRQNSFYLSGLLIGAEINHLIQHESAPLFLCSGSNLYPLYKSALEQLDHLNRTTIVPVDLVNSAAIAGQVLIYREHFLKAVSK